MRKNLTQLVALLIVGTAAASVASGCGSAESKAAAPHVLRFLSVDQSYEAASGFNEQRLRVGDRFAFTTALFNRRTQFGKPSGARVGSADVLCTVIATARLYCTGVADLPGGYILLANPARIQRKVVHGVVIGGVGAYANARGTSDVTYLKRDPNGRDTNEIVIRLTA